MSWMSGVVERSWYSRFGWSWILLPFTLIFQYFAQRREIPKRSKPDDILPVPVVIIGNLSVGGTGKTPLIIALVKYLKSVGCKPGVVSRGYGGQAANYPLQVMANTSSLEAGDEPVLVARHCPVVVDPNRLSAARHLLENNDCNVILSDDGLQHYRLPRDIEIVVVDGTRGFGNGLCLPAGPLREPLSRLERIDMMVVNGDQPVATNGESNAYLTVYSKVLPIHFRRLSDNKTVAIKDFPQGQVHAVAGIGNPQRFMQTLKDIGLEPVLHSYSDHHNFNGNEFLFNDQLPVIITAKDAVKCHPALLESRLDSARMENIWILDVEAVPETALFHYIHDKLNSLMVDQQS